MLGIGHFSSKTHNPFFYNPKKTTKKGKQKARKAILFHKLLSSGLEIVSVNHKTFSSIEKGYKRSTLYIKGGVSEFRVPLCGSEGILQVNNRHLNKGVGLGFFKVFSAGKCGVFSQCIHQRKIIYFFEIITKYFP